MKSVKNKLSSKSGASMLLALVFLMFCMFVGGSVLAAATANGSRTARQKENQQAYLSQRSASLLLADLLKGDENSAMQLTIKDVVRADNTRKVTFMIHDDSEKSALQRMLYDFAVRKYALDHGLKLNEGVYEYVNFKFAGVTGVGYAPTDPPASGSVNVALTEGEKITDTLKTQYNISGYGDFELDYAVEIPAKEEGGTVTTQNSYMKLTMECYDAVGQPVTVNDVRTTTTIIRWDDPVIEKGGE